MLYSSDDFRELSEALAQISSPDLFVNMETAIYNAWQQLVAKYARNGTTFEMVIQNQQGQAIGILGAHDTNLKHLEQAIEDQAVLTQRFPVGNELDIQDLLEPEPVLFPWLYLANGTCAYGGKHHAQSLNAFAGLTFRNGYCYLNLFVPLSVYVAKYNVEAFSHFILKLPEVLGSYPSLFQVLSTILFMSKHFPELTSEAIPVIGFDPENLQFHVVDARGLPGLWPFLQCQKIHDLLSVLSRYRESTFMLYPVGAIHRYSQWPMRLHHFSTNKFVDLEFLLKRLKFVIDNDMADEGTREAAIDELMNMGMTNVVGSEKRFPGETATDVVLVNMNEEAFRSQLSHLRNFLLSGYRGKTTGEINDEAKTLAANTLQTLSTRRSQTVPIYTRAIFELKHKVVWDAEYAKVPLLKQQLVEAAKFIDTVAQDIDKTIERVRTKPEIVAEEAPQQPPTEEAQTAQRIEVVNAPQRSPAIEIIIGLVTTFLALVITFLIRAFMRIKGLNFTIKRDFPWIIEKADDDDDGDEGGGDQPRGGQNQHNSREVNTQNLRLEDEELSEEEDYSLYDDDLRAMRQAIETNDFQQMEDKQFRWVAILNHLSQLGIEGSPYASMITYFEALTNAYHALDTRGTLSVSTLVSIAVLENELRLAGIIFDEETPMTRLQSMQRDSPLTKWRAALRKASLTLGKECLMTLDELLEQIRADCADRQTTEFETFVSGLIITFCRALHNLIENEDQALRVNLIANAEGILGSLNNTLSSDLQFPIIDAIRRTNIAEIVQSRIPNATTTNANDLEILITKEAEKLQSEIDMNNAIAQSNRDMARANRETVTREHILRPLDTAASLGLAGVIYRGQRTAPAIRPAAASRTVFTGRGHRLGGGSSFVNRVMRR